MLQSENDSATLLDSTVAGKRPDTRERYSGQGKMGRAFGSALDRADLGKAIVEVGAAHQLMLRLSSPEYADLTKSERRTMIKEALAHAHLGNRFIEGVLDRNDYEP